jgi:hypothetical protein
MKGKLRVLGVLSGKISNLSANAIHLRHLIMGIWLRIGVSLGQDGLRHDLLKRLELLK